MGACAQIVDDPSKWAERENFNAVQRSIFRQCIISNKMRAINIAHWLFIPWYDPIHKNTLKTFAKKFQLKLYWQVEKSEKNQLQRMAAGDNYVQMLDLYRWEFKFPLMCNNSMKSAPWTYVNQKCSEKKVIILKLDMKTFRKIFNWKSMR